MEHLLGRLIEFPTVSNRPVTELGAFLAQHAEDLGFRVENFHSEPGKVNVVATIGPERQGGLALSGHMDVVPVAEKKWDTDPFSLTLREGRFYGRGTCDMKGFVAASMVALESLDLSSLNRPLVLVWTHDEEVGCKGSENLVSTFQQLGRVLPEVTWIGEPTDLRLCRMHPGHTTIQIRCVGKAAHSSRPELGASAIRAAGWVLDALEAVERSFRQAPWAQAAGQTARGPMHPVMNVGRVTGGSAVNVVPALCTIDVGIRQLPGQDGVKLFRYLESALVPVVSKALAHGVVVEVSLDGCTASLLSPDGTSLIRHLAPQLDDSTETIVPFATDGGNLSALQTAPVVCGPGSIAQAHRENEFVEADALVKTVGLVSEAIQSLCC